jgi:hypothetical protein
MEIDITFFVLLLLILSVGFILRAALILKYGWAGKDTFYHYLISKEIRREKRLPKTVDRFIEPEQYDYPPLLHFLLSKVPERWYKGVQLFAPFTDILAALFIFIFCLINFDPPVALIAVAIYCFTPFAIDISFSMGPRVIANLLLIICLISTYYAVESFTMFSIIVATISAALVLLTQRLAVQSLVAVLTVVMVVWSTFTPIIVLIIAFFLAMLLSRGFYLTVLRGHIDFVKVMGSRLMDSEKRKVQPSPILDLKAITFNLPIIFILPLTFIQLIDWSSLIIFLFTWVISLLVLSALWIFGEGYRHMANSVAPLAIIGGAWAVQSGDYKIIIGFISISLVLSLYKVYRLDKMRQLGIVVTSDVLDAFRFIRDNGSTRDVVLTIPTDLTYHAAYFTGAIVAHSSGGCAKGLSYNMGVNKMVKEGRVNELISELNIRWILTLNDTLINVPRVVEKSFGPDVHLYRVKNQPGLVGLNKNNEWNGLPK